MIEELVVLVDDNDNEIGTMPKAEVHTKATPLHRGFSLYVFNPQGEVLAQQRKKEKLTWGGFWSNSCCGHPAPNETREEAAERRAKQELGIEVKNIEKVADYRYRFKHNGVVENEVCPILVGLAANADLYPDPREIENFRWMRWSEFLEDMETHQEIYSPWSKEQIKILLSNQNLKEWLKKNSIELK